MKLRSLAAAIINDVTNGNSLTHCLETRINEVKEVRDRAFLQAICYGVCRYYSYLDVVLSRLLKKPMKAKDSDVHALLLVGLYQLTHMRVPAHAAVAETVNAIGELNKPWARGFGNAVLREYLRNKDQIEAAIQSDPEAIYAHPSWWIEQIKKDWPLDWQTILNANNVHPPFALRVNQRMTTREEYLALLQTTDVLGKIIPETSNGIVLEVPMLAEALPGFSTGMVSVQDGAAQLAVEILDLAPMQRVLDACAAPGGKLLHILEHAPELAACIAVEKNPERLPLIEKNLARANLHAQCICSDVNQVEQWWDGELFDRILLDAPCSASGVIRRHPDIKLLRHPKDVAAFAKEQRNLLDSLWPLLKQGGLLVYVTCSIFPEENTRVVQKFISSQLDATEEIIQATWGTGCKIGRQIFPGTLNMDGFYYAKIRKI